MTVDRSEPGDLAAAASEAMLGSWSWLGDHLPAGWAERDGAALALVTGLPAPTLNGVWCAHGTEAAQASRLLDAVAGSGLPHCAQFPSGSPMLRAMAQARGLVREVDMPLMRLDADSASAAGPPEPEGLMIRRLEPAEASVHAVVAARGFGAPEAVFAPLVSPALASRDELAYYVGELEGEPVVTGLGLRLDDCVGVFDVATPPEARRRGYGAALTARIVADGFHDGARWSWLQSSPDGHRVYQRLGFRDVASWECWITA